MRPLLLPGGAGAQIKSRELKARAKAVAQAAASDGRGGDRPITLCPADDWHKGVAGRRLGPLQVRARHDPCASRPSRPSRFRLSLPCPPVSRQSPPSAGGSDSQELVALAGA